MAVLIWVLDTTVLVDHLRALSAATSWLLGLDDVPLASELTRVEVIQGLRSDEVRAAEQLFAEIDWLPVTEPIARVAGELGRRYRPSHGGIGVVDLVVAATALGAEATLATANVRHYPMFPHLAAPY
ncbi:MAG: type II toxin-antitoxin system VapC family toxin [Acidimicrobiales bacterium]